MMKKGFIKISDIIYREQYDYIYSIFKDFRPTYIEFRHWENNTWYIYGECDFFDELREADAIRQYDVMVTKHDNGTFSYKFLKV